MTRFEEAWRTLSTNPVKPHNNNSPRQEAYIWWNAPPSGWMVLNMDGAALLK